MVADRDLVLAKRTQQSENQGRWVPACAGMTAGNHLRLPRPEPTGPMAAFPADATGSRPHRARLRPIQPTRSEEHTSELQSLMRISYAVFCLKKKTRTCTQIDQ